MTVDMKVAISNDTVSGKEKLCLLIRSGKDSASPFCCRRMKFVLSKRKGFRFSIAAPSVFLTQRAQSVRRGFGRIFD